MLDSLSRAKMALLSGVDIVFELPTLYTVRDAKAFASGGVSLLNGLNICDYLCFGCEDCDALDRAYLLDEDDPQVAAQLRNGLDRGETFARARGLPNLPNLILGVEYRRALTKLNSSIKPVPIPRTPACETAPAVTSASAIRSMLPHIDSAAQYMPGSAFDILARDQGALRSQANLDALLLGILRTTSLQSLRNILDVGEGLEHRMLRAALTATSREDFLTRVKCKRYTYTRLSRALTQAALAITKTVAAGYNQPHYARLLGFRKRAQPLLRYIHDNSTLTIIDRPACFQYDPLFQLDLRAESITALAAQSTGHRHGDGMLTSNIVIV